MYRSARTVYGPFQAKMAVLLFFTAMIIPVWALFSSTPEAFNEDYSVLAVWFIIVPITGMVLLNYHLVMKKALEKRRLRQK